MIASQTSYQRFFDSIIAVLFLRFIPQGVKPNHLTAARMFMTPIILWLVLSNAVVAAGIVFVIAAFTDALDGAMARTRNQITDIGRILDPVADKLLIGSLLIPLVAVALDPLLAILLFVLELAFLFGGFYRRYVRKAVIQANGWGKTKFALQVLGIALLLLSFAWSLPALESFALASFSLALGFGVVSLTTEGF